jgi:hypothetical protein
MRTDIYDISRIFKTADEIIHRNQYKAFTGEQIFYYDGIAYKHTNGSEIKPH